MKITGIEIGEYRQFKNIKFDFTYPADHPTKAGQPLDKVCFIGQSGTGKTTLLNVIWKLIIRIERETHYRGANQVAMEMDDERKAKNIKPIYVSLKNENQQIDGSFKIFDSSSISTHSTPFRYLNGEFTDPTIKTLVFKNFTKHNKICIFIKDCIAREADAFLVNQKDLPKSFSDFVKTTTEAEKDKADFQEWINKVGFQKTVSLGDMDSLSTWQYLLNDITNYDEDTLSIASVLGQVSEQNFGNAIQEFLKQLSQNPRIELGQKCLNQILEKFFLELNLGGSLNVPISIQTRQGVKIDSSYLSTGIRQILATAIPIYKFDTTDTVILFDEPERSLFPDIQRELIQYYTGLAPKAQFFFATHSPIIAAAFEPCERFILDFNEDGEVICRKGVAPIGDDPNDVLRQDFGMSPLMNDDGLEAYERYRQLAVQIRNETNEEKKNQLIADRIELGNRYNFSGQYAKNQ
jgi:energy-coupling factor transporter ATP-binding protein EcfA2